MPRLRAGLRRLGDRLLRTRRERDLAAELDSHLQLHIDDNLRAGMTPAEARRQAVLALGGVEQTKEQVRAARATWLDAAGRDVALACRHAVRRRWHVITIVVMLAAGIAGSTAVFSFLCQILLQPIGIAEPARLVVVDETTPPNLARRGVEVSDRFPYDAMAAQRAQNLSFSAIGMAATRDLALLAGGGEARRVVAAFVSAGYFEALGVRLRAGRSFEQADDTTAERIAVISDRLWTRAFDRDGGVIGRDIRVNGRACRIVGIAPQEFMGHDLAQRVDVWLAWGSQAAVGMAPSSNGLVFARLAGDVTIAQAAARAAVVGDRYRATLSAEDQDRVGQPRLRAFDMNRSDVLASLLPQPWLLLTVPLLMLALACANVANLQLADIETRQREFASRAALGASRGAIVRQVLSEALVPGVAAGAAGLLLAFPCMTLLQRVPTQRMTEPRLDVVLQPEAAALAVSLALVSMLVAGVLPAVRASRTSLADAIKAGSGVVTPTGRLKDVLVVVQVALALTLVTAGILVTRSLDAARHQDLGMRPEGVIGIRLQWGSAGDARGNAPGVQRLLDGARALPGVRMATVSPGFPLENVVATVIGSKDRTQMAALVGADHFATLGVRLLAGRELGPEDVASGSPVVVVNETLARSWWPGLDPLGRSIGRFRVVGVVADHATFAGEDMHKPMAYVHLPDAAGRWPCLLVRTDGDPRALASSLQQLARQVDPGAPILRVATLADHLDGLHHHLRVASWLLGLCGLASLALAAIGIYSLLAYRVARQRKEIGLRMALGATRQTVVRQVVSRLLWGVVPGLALGGAGSFLLNRTFPSLFAGPAALDARALTLGAAVLLGASLLASAAPAYHATRIEPAITLRGD